MTTPKADAAARAALRRMTFRDAAETLEVRLSGLGVRVPIEPGAPSDAALAAQFPRTALLVLALGGGPGLQAEGMIDVVTLSVLTIGSPNSYTSAETLALLVDQVIVPNRADLTGDQPERWGYVDVLWRARVGGPPSVVERETPASGRWHGVGSYLLGVASTP